MSSELKHGIGISENDLKQLKQVISTEFKIDLQSIVSINWVINEGNSEMHKFFRDQLKSEDLKEIYQQNA